MKKIVPKIPKAQGLFKNLPWFDMAYLAILSAVAILIFLSNLGIAKYIILAALVIIAVVTEIRNEGVSIANVLFYRMQSMSKPLLYIKSTAVLDSTEKSIDRALSDSGEDITDASSAVIPSNMTDNAGLNKKSKTMPKPQKSLERKSRSNKKVKSQKAVEPHKVVKPHKSSKPGKVPKPLKTPKPHKVAYGFISDIHKIVDIKESTIFFSSGTVAQLIEIPDISFVLKDESQQDNYIHAFGKCFNVIAPYKNVTFIKTEREIDYSEFIDNLRLRKENVLKSKRYTITESEARAKVLQTKIEQFMELTGITQIPVYHMVIRGMHADVTEQAAQLIDDLISADMVAYLATSDNIAKAIAAQYHRRIDTALLSHGESLVDVALPDRIEVKPKCVIIDGVKVTTYAINSLPSSVTNAWIAALCNVPNVNVTINVAHSNSSKLVRKIDRAYFTAGSEAEQTSKLSESVTKNSQQNSMESLVEDVEYSQDKLCEIEILISFINNDRATENEVNKHILDHKMKRNTNKYMQIENFVNCLVNNMNSPMKRNKHVFTTKLMGMAFPMIFPNLLEAKGDFVGYNECGVPVVVDYHARDGKLRVNSNMCAFGKSGGGKSFYLKQYLLLRAASGDICLIIDADGEYIYIAEELGGIIIDLNSQDFRINPLHAFSLTSDGKNSVSDHILVVEEFFKVLLQDISMEQCIVLKDVLAKLYDKFGITDDIDVRNVDSEQFPTMQDLYDMLDLHIHTERDLYAREHMIKLRLLMRSMLSGVYGKYWNGHSKLNIANNFIVFNVQTLLASGNLAVVNAQMKLISRYVNTQLIENFKNLSQGNEYHRIVVLIDEVHRMLAPGMTVTIDLCGWLAKQCRKYEGALVVASQSVIDIISTPELLSKTKAVLTESQNNTLLGCRSTHIPDILAAYSHANLSDMEIDSLKDAKRGRALMMVSDAMRVPVQITANDYEFKLCSRKIDQ